MTKQNNIAATPFVAHNIGEVTELIDALLDQSCAVRYSEVPRPRAMPAMPTHPSREVKVNPFGVNMRAIA